MARWGNAAYAAWLCCAVAAWGQASPVPTPESDATLAHAEQVLAAKPADPGAKQALVDTAVELALAARKAGDPDAALRYLMRARGSLPQDRTLLLDFGLQADAMRLFRDADAALTEAVQQDSPDPKAIYALGRVKLDEGEDEAAVALLRRYLALRPADASAHYGLGHVLHIEQHDEEASAELHESIRLQPVQTESYYELGAIALAEHRDEIAGEEFERTLQRDAHHAGALAGMGTLALRQKDYSKAVDLLRQSLATAPNYPETHRSLALALAKLGRSAESARELAEAERLTREQDQARGGLVLQH